MNDSVESRGSEPPGLDRGPRSLKDNSVETEESRELLTTGDMARRSDNSLRVVRHYEQLGLLETVGRSNGGHRLFAPSELKKLQLINVLRDLGLSLKTISALIQARGDSEEGQIAARRLSTALSGQIEAIDQRITDLRRARDEVAAARAALEECRHHDVAWEDAQCEDCSLMDGERAPKTLKSILL